MNQEQISWDSQEELRAPKEKNLVESHSYSISNKKPVLVWSDDSVYELKKHIAWGENLKRNQIEQGGLLVGNIFKHEKSEHYWGEVQFVIPAYKADASLKHLHFSVVCWVDMLDRVEGIRRMQKNKPQIIGWYHTHPTYLKVYFSRVDLELQKKWFDKPWYFAVVLNPQKKIINVFQGGKATLIDDRWRMINHKKKQDDR